MEIKELKSLIETNSLSDDQMIWKISDHDVWGLTTDESCWFIAKQYIEKIAKNKKLDIKYINSFDEVTEDSLIPSNNLYIYKTDELKDFTKIKNSIIICNKTSSRDAIIFPKLESWQFIDYIKTIVPGISSTDLDWLATQYNFTYSRETWMRYFMFYNDMLKISIFPEDQQQEIFNYLYKNGEYSTISNLTIFDLSNAILRKDKKLALEVLRVFPYIDSKPDLWLLSILLNNFKRVIDIQLNPLLSASELGISDKQYYAIKKNNVGVYSNKELIKIYKMLTNIEYKFKFEGLSSNQVVDYIVLKILGGID